MLRDRKQVGFGPALIGSTCTHIVAITVFFVISDARPAVSPHQTVVMTKLVRLGKKRPKDLLPRKQTSQPPRRANNKTPPAATKSPEKKVQAPKKAKKKTPKKAKKKAPRKETQHVATQARNLSSALSRLKDTERDPEEIIEEEAEGDPTGSAFGTETDISTAIAGNRYMNEIYACMKRNYHIEGLGTSAKSLKDKKVTVLVRVSAQGSITNYAIEESSGVAAFDRSVEKAIRQCDSVSPPPPEIIRQVVRQGIEIVFKPN